MAVRGFGGKLMKSTAAVARCLLKHGSSTANQQTAAAGTLTVLIVDDDDAFRKQLYAELELEVNAVTEETHVPALSCLAMKGLLCD